MSAERQHKRRLSAAERLSYGIAEAAEAIGVGRSTIWRLIEAGELETFKFGARTLIRRDALEALVDRRSGRSPSPPSSVAA